MQSVLQAFEVIAQRAFNVACVNSNAECLEILRKQPGFLSTISMLPETAVSQLHW